MHGARCTITCSDRSRSDPRRGWRSAAHHGGRPARRRRRAALRLAPPALVVAVQVEVPLGLSNEHPLKVWSRSVQAIAQTFRVPLDEHVGAPEAGDPRLRNGRGTGLEPIWHVAPFRDQRTRCGLARQCSPMSEGRPASPLWRSYETDLSSWIGGFFPWSERRCPRTRAVPTTARTTAPALSSTRERPAYGAAKVSMKPNRPKLTLTRSPPMVATMNPAPATTTSSRRQSSSSRARRTPAIPWSRNSGPIVGIVR